MRILLVEDDIDLRTLLVARLQDTGYVVDIAADGHEGLYFAETVSYAAVILDIGLPMMDGLTVLDRIRADANTTPVLLLTARGGWRNKVSGLRAGADDYLTKPFETEELLARLEALIRRSSGLGDPVVRIEGITIDMSARSVQANGVPIALTANEYRALEALLARRGTVMSKAELAEQIWLEDLERGLNAVEVTVARIRRKLPVDLTQTKRGHGYLIA